MATRALSHFRKSSLVNALSQAGFPSCSSTTIKHGHSPAPGAWGSDQTMERSYVESVLRKEIFSSITSANLQHFPAVGLLQRNLSCSPVLGSSLGVSWLSPSFRYYSTAGVYANINTRFSKQRRNRGEMKGVSRNHISFGKYALEALEPAWITSKQILAGQLAIKRNMRGGKLFLRIFPHKPISLRPAETRMGRGKGSTAYWVAGVKAGRILYEINGVPESVARRAISVAASKMPIRTQFIRSLG